MKKHNKFFSVMLCLIMIINVFAIMPINTKAVSNGWAWPTDIHSMGSDWPVYSNGCTA